jgi:hypothetical protein
MQENMTGRSPAHSVFIEPLEPRYVLSGNILASFAGGVLTLTAETALAAENIQIEMVDPSGDFSASGQVAVFQTDLNTTINGFTTFLSPIGQTVREIKIDLKAGDDALALHGVQIAGSLTARLGEGANTVFVDGDTHIGGSLSLKGGLGNDSFDFANGVTIGKALTLSAGAGTNDIDLVFGVQVGGALIVSAGAGNDTVRFGRLFVGGTTTVGLGDGQNVLTNDVSDAGTTQMLGAAKFSFGAGADTFDLAKGTLFGAGLTATLGAGSNVAELEAFTVGKSVSIIGGVGSDFVRVADGNISGSLKVALGNGFNSFSMDDVTEIPTSDPSNVITSTVGTTILGGLTVTGGTDIDRIEIGDERPVRVFGATQIRTGDETLGGDIVQIDDAAFYGSFLLNTGAGSDTIILDSKASNFGTVFFAAAAKVLAGAGTDHLRLGTANTAQSGVFFVVKPILDGGAGTSDQFEGLDYFFGGVNGPLGEKGWEV